MNLPSFIRAAFATGSLSTLLLLSAAAVTPPDLQIKTTSANTGAVTSGASAQLNGHIYYAGGHPNGTSAVTNVVTDLNLQTGTVSNLAPMPTARAGLGLVGFLYTPPSGAQDVLFAIGGVDAAGTPLGTVEVYSFKTGSWSAFPSLASPRGYLAVVAGHDNYVYAIGGIDASGHSVSTVERFNQIANTWGAAASLNTSRSHFGAAYGSPNTIYAVGGIDDDGNVLNSTEVYPTTVGGPWFPWTFINEARSDFGIAAAGDGFLHIFGGKTKKGALKSVEGYNFNTGVWTVEPEKLPGNEQGLSASEGLDGNAYLLGGKSGTKALAKARVGIPPAAASHAIFYYLHALDEPQVNGNPAMDEQVPFGIGTILSLGLLQSVSWSTFPAVNGTVDGPVTVTIPSTIGLGVLFSFTLTASDLDGSNPVQVGSVSSLLGLSGTVTIPITNGSIVLKNKVLTLTATIIVGLNLNLSASPMYLVVNGLTGTPSNQ